MVHAMCMFYVGLGWDLVDPVGNVIFHLLNKRDLIKADNAHVIGSSDNNIIHPFNLGWRNIKYTIVFFSLVRDQRIVLYIQLCVCAN